MVEEANREPAARQAHLLLAVPVDDVVLSGGSRPPGLAPGGRAAGFALELQGDVLGDMTHPGAVAQPLDKPAGAVQRTTVVVKAGKQVDKGIGEVRQRVRGPVLERAEVHEQADGRLVRPVVGTAQYLALEDLQVGSKRRLVRDRFVLGVLVALDSRVRARIAHSDAFCSSFRTRRRWSARSSRPSAAAWRTILAMRLCASCAIRSFLLSSSGRPRRARKSNR